MCAWLSCIQDANLEKILQKQIEYTVQILLCRAEVLDIIDNAGDSYFETVFYLNIIEQMEKMGDYLINISQALLK